MMIALLLVGAVVAEMPDIHTALLPGGKSDAFPMFADACKAAGISLPEIEALGAVWNYPCVNMNNGREQFDVCAEMDAVAGEFGVTGFNLTLSDVADANCLGQDRGE